ncbi:MAG: paraquat-inducible protein A [Bacteroidota bacterium]
MSNKTRTYLFVAVSTIFFAVALYFSLNLLNAGKSYRSEMEEYARVLTFENRLLNIDEWANPDASWPETRARAEKQREEAVTARGQMNEASFIFVLGSFLYLIASFFLFFKKADFYKYFTLSLIIVALLCLYVGIFCPMIELSALKNDLKIPIEINVPLIDYTIDMSKTFDGKMYFYYQNKSATDLISLLFRNNNFFVGFCILLFSVVIPFFKMSVSIAVLFKPALLKKKFHYFVVHKIGKWSMADVFVAASFLAYLSFNNMNTGIETQSVVLPGLYFFLAYCIISLVSSHLISVFQKQNMQVTTIENK